jgi:hypothetical protein
MAFSFSENQKRALKRGLTLGLFAGVLTALGYFASVIPADQAVFGTVLTAVIGYIEKAERNYRENK